MKKLQKKYPKNTRILAVDPGIHGSFTNGVEVRDPPIYSVKVGKNKSGTDKMRSHYSIPELATSVGVLIQEPMIAVIESVSSMPHDGVSSAFLFGNGLGLYQGMCAARGLELVMVKPSVWKRYFGLIKKTKEDSRQLALKLFPMFKEELKLKKNEGRAEALLIYKWAQENLIDRE